MDSLVLTPNGFITIKEAKVGDRVLTPDGSISRIIDIPFQGKEDTYKVTFSDGSSVCASGGHEWKVTTADWKKTLMIYRKKRTVEMISSLRMSGNRIRYYIPLVSSSLEFPKQKHIISPYILGVLLGDGTITKKNPIKITNMSSWIYKKVLSQLFKGYHLTKQIGRLKNNYNISRKGYRYQNNPNIYAEELLRMGLLGKRAKEKFVPDEYLFDSKKNRLEILQGLMDTDGHIRKRDRNALEYCYSTMSEKLKDGVVFLAQSLGGTAIFHVEKGCYRLSICLNENVCTVPHKASKLGKKHPKRGIMDISFIGKREVKCITIDHPDNLFITNSFIVTHNSVGGGKSDALLMAALQYVDYPHYAALLLRDTFKNLSMPSSLMNRAMEWLANSDASWDEKIKTWTFPSGATITFGYLDGPYDHLNYNCLSEDHDVLTNKGWKKIKDVTTEDMVASLRPTERIFSFFPVKKVYSYNYKGKMIQPANKADVSFSCTPNHKIIYSTRRNKKLRFCTADTIPMTAKIPQTGEWVSGKKLPKEFVFSSDGHNGKSIRFNTKDFVWFLGWYIAEGSLDKGRWTIKISQNNCEEKEELFKRLKQNHINAWYGDKDISFCNKALFIWLEENCGKGSHNKKIPRFLLDAKKEYLKILLDSLVIGDGHKYSEDYSAYITVSPFLFDDIMELGFKCGCRVTGRKFTYDENRTILGRRIGHSGDYYALYILNKKDDTLIANKKERKPIQIDYDGKVYCIEVEPYNNFLIRHNNRICWTGNSAEFQFIGIDEAADLRWFQMIFMFSRLRKTKDNPVPLRYRLASNPGGISHIELKLKYIDNETREEGVVFIPAGIDDNPYLEKTQYIKSLNKLDPVTRQRLLNGDWEIRDQGRLFSRDWFSIVEGPPPPANIASSVRYWDLAATEIKKVQGKQSNDPDYTAGCRMHRLKNNTYVIDSVIRFRKSPKNVEEIIRQTAEIDGRSILICMEQEPGSSGVNTIDHYRRYVLPGYNFRANKATGSKAERAAPLSSMCESGNVALVKGPWLKDFLDEMEVFPSGKHDDQVDAASGAFEKIALEESRYNIRIRRL